MTMAKISKITVSTGVYWIDVPDADLRVLCGCPADSVKQLMKRGLIASKEQDGVVVESGPNAILLSDFMLQNGQFSNLAEFPVLQMLYKQGMILPNHPGNTGGKPLIMGLSEQVHAQMQYIYRGNYGLVSKEEMLQVGLGAETAEELMRLKLKFAFGNIHPSDNLLDSLTIGAQSVEIRNGVMIRRLGMNVFEFSYAGETVSVDLNLGPNVVYESAYQLGYQKIKREYFSIIHSGDGDGWNIAKPSMSSIIIYQGRIYLIDAGPNLNYQLNALGISINEIEGIFQTHCHDDHFAGITTLMRSGRRIKYYATPLVLASIEKKFAALLSFEEERFLDFFEVHNLNLHEWNDIEGLEVRPVLSPHPVETSIFFFRTFWENGYLSYAHFADIVSMKVLEGMITASGADAGVSRAFFDKIREEYMTSAEIKKLDVGEGLIHGDAEDFRTDESKKILLSHTSQELTDRQKQLGSSAAFGAADVLIPGTSNFIMKNAFHYLNDYFPSIAEHDIKLILNAGTTELNPGTIIVKEGDPIGHAYMLLTGSVEVMQAESNFKSVISAGTVFGDLCGIYNLPSAYTYRTASFVTLLRIPCSLYMQLSRKYNLPDKMESIFKMRSFLQSVNLFSEGIEYPVLKKIIDAASCRNFSEGDVVGSEDMSAINLIKNGRVERTIGEDVLETLGARSVFGEEVSVFDTPSLFRFRIVEPTEVFRIPGEILRDIPIVRWKLFETYKKRISEIVYSRTDGSLFQWREEFKVNIHSMDTHHKRLFEIANSILESQRHDSDRSRLEKAFDALFEYTKYHFRCEELLMKQYGFPQYDEHVAHHKDMLLKVRAVGKKIGASKSLKEIDFKLFLEAWLVSHLLSDDRKYGTFLNERGVY